MYSFLQGYVPPIFNRVVPKREPDALDNLIADVVVL